MQHFHGAGGGHGGAGRMGKAMEKNEGGGKVQKFQITNLLGLFRLTRAYKKEYIIFFTFLVLQVISFQLLTFSLEYLISTLFPMKKVSVLLLYAAAWTMMFAMHGLVTVLSARYRIVIVRSLVANVRSEIIRKMQVLSIRYFDTRGTGATSAKILMDVDRVQGFFDWFLTGFLTAVISIVTVVPLLTSIDPLLTLVTFVYLPTIPILQKMFWKVIMERSYKLRNTNARLSEKLIDYISGIKLIRMFANEEEQSARIISEVDNVRNIDIKYSVVMRNFQMAVQFFGDFMPILLWVAVGIIMIYNGHLTMGAAVAYIGLVRGLLGSIQVLFSSFDQIVAASPSVTAIMEIIKNDEVENANPSVHEFTIDGSIRMNNVNFSYQTRAGQQQLTNVNLSIKPGENVAFVGESGSGKSTLVNVLMGLYPITSGSIQYGDLDLSTMKLQHLRSQIAVMSQETFLFNTSLFENIKFARLDATPQEITQACVRAQIHDFIESLPEKYETCAGERGVQLSGGQRQRIGLARVFLRNPRLIILDEPSSSLDVFTEQRLFETLFENIKDVTLIIIAHRLSTIKGVDRIFVFQDGQIVEQGQFDELAKGSGRFADMVKANAVLG